MSKETSPIIMYEHYRKSLGRGILTEDDIEILEDEFSDKIEIIQKRNEDELRTHQYVGYIVLPNNVIVIEPKIPGIGFLNMLRYALDLPDLGADYPELTKGEDYYDILVRFLLTELEKMLQRGLYTGYKNYEDNVTRLRGKILFKENIIANYNRNDKIFCSFSEISSDITENRIIKYTLFYLLHCSFVDKTIEAQLMRYYQRLDEVNLVPITTQHFKSVEYTILNLHYKPILTLCELLLKDSALDEEIGEKNSISFLLDMNKLFEEFVANVLRKRLTSYEIDLQKSQYPVKADKSVSIRLDILINYKGSPILIVDTKYQDTEGKPDESHLAQMCFYSNTTHVKNCALIYTGKSASKIYPLEENIIIHVISFDLTSANELDFESKCNNFVNKIEHILNSNQTYRVE